ncbi:hypothetical protein FAIPA1_40299 [Frankia sp. AiPs1]|uniref:DUF6924 domain-containing protein n=1 Tax=Frankia sp. AiPa1 TaxID=573492 RepID=UPI00202B8B1C|nr:hypothetical protein [Frankia sp. AiPa1]MCL9761263.1 hypothetical protein [Frankia sp. AiPa1]
MSEDAGGADPSGEIREDGGMHGAGRAGGPAPTSDPRLRTEDTPLIRTDFTDDAAWELVERAVGAPYGQDGFCAYVESVVDRAFDGYTAEQLLPLLPVDIHAIAFVIDRATLACAENPVLVVKLGDPDDGRGQSFRALPYTLHSIENNLSIVNMDWEEFADSVDADGVFREDWS